MPFNDKEILMIKNSVLLRQKINGIDEKFDKKFDRILVKLKYGGFNLDPSEKAFIRGCVKESEIEPNKRLNSFTELDLFLADDNIKSEFINFDLANGILNKLRSKNDDIEHLFEPSFQKFDKIKKADKILFSISNNGNFYKLAFVMNKKNGYRVNINERKFNEFKMSDINESSFTNSGNASDLITYLEWYEMKNSETDNLKILKMIAEKASG